MKNKLFSQISENITFFEEFDKALKKNIAAVSSQDKVLSLALKECVLDYLIINEHAQIAFDILKAEYSLVEQAATYESITTLSQLYSGLKDYDYYGLKENVKKLNDKSKIVSNQNVKVQDLAKQAIYLLKQEIKDYRLFSCLDKLSSLISHSQLDIEFGNIENICAEKNRLLEYYNTNVSLLDLIKDYSQKIDEDEINSKLQQDIISELESFFTQASEMLGDTLNPILAKLANEIENTANSGQISLLLEQANDAVFNYSFGTLHTLAIQPPDLSIIPQDELVILKDYIDELGNDSYSSILKALDNAFGYIKYQELSTNILDPQGVTSFRAVLFTLAELKLKALTSNNNYIWNPIIETLESKLAVDKKINNYVDDALVIKFKNNSNFAALFKLKLNILMLSTYYDLSFERLLGGVTNINKFTLQKNAWLSNTKLKDIKKAKQEEQAFYKLSSPNNIKDKDDQNKDLYEKFNQIIIAITKFKQVEFKDFKTFNIDNYLLDFEAKNSCDFLNKKLAYKTLYQRYFMADHNKSYEKIYSQWIELNVLYGDGFSTCGLEENVTTIENLLIKIREKFLTEDMHESCDKLVIEISNLYIKCCEKDLCGNIKDKTEQDMFKLENLNNILQKKNPSADDIKFIKNIEDTLKSSAARKDKIDFKYISELEENCKKQNPLFGSGQKLDELSQQLNKLNLGGDKKACLTELSKVLASL
ncbi:hypothetical protein [Francisella sp. XLW-1]|uniref:hypothetical protein n=1 Tax=Francisella sp. XLW-1 TaxID=2610887 RepID=UPI00123D9256|nr:hypothetical protein [Francisella sp. XLW-1]